MTTITISRQLGSQGEEVARAVAERLGYRIACRDLINQAARDCGAPEMALAFMDDLGLLEVHPTLKARRSFLLSVRQLMEDLASQGNFIILGRAGQVILSKIPGTLHTRVIAPAGLRAQRIASLHQIPLSAAQAQIEASDQARRLFLRRYYHARWDDPDLYDLILNTARLEPEEAAWLICQAVQH